MSFREWRGRNAFATRPDFSKLRFSVDSNICFNFNRSFERAKHQPDVTKIVHTAPESRKRSVPNRLATQCFFRLTLEFPDHKG